MQNLIDIIYENFFLIIIVFIFIIITFGMTLVKVLMDKIETRVLYLRKNDAIWYKAITEKDGTILFTVNKQPYRVVKNSDPYIIKMGRTFVTLFMVKEKEKVTIDVRKDRGQKFKDVKSLETALTELVESEITRQGVKGLTEGLEIPLTYKIGLVAIGIAILYFVQLIAERVR